MFNVNFVDCLVIMLFYLITYSLVHRICSCFENCAMAKYLKDFSNKKGNKIDGEEKEVIREVEK